MRPLPGRPPLKAAPVVAPPAFAAPSAFPPPTALKPTGAPQRRPADYLDGSWERRIATGNLQPDISLDLHGHTLPAAHRRLNAAIAGAIAHRLRVMLVVTGKPRTGTALPGEQARGAIRAEIGDWLAASPHADAIASVRSAHPRHGGAGALYIILRRN